MAVPGRKPAEATQKRNRNTPQAEWVEIQKVPYAGAVPDLPKRRTVLTREGQEQVELQALTVKWWETISVMPHCTLWTDSDWMFALSTAMVADAAFCGIASAATELRNREKVLGTTVEFRRDLRIRYVETEAVSQPEGVANIADYRNL